MYTEDNNSSLDGSLQSHSYFTSKNIESPPPALEEEDIYLLPVCDRLFQYLEDKGCNTVKLIKSDIIVNQDSNK